MPISEEPKKDRPNTYFVQDKSSRHEFERLHIADQNITRGMGGVLAEQADPTQFHTILDVGCGTGDWLVEAVQAYPSISRGIGVDISDMMLAQARTLAQERLVSDRVEFAVMDA